MKRNPFVIQGYLDAEHFCDREKESRMLYSDWENGRNVTLLAPRRYGKTELVRHVCIQHASEVTAIFVDLLSTSSLFEFVNVFAKAAIGALDSPVERGLAVFTRFLKSVRPTIAPDVQGSFSFSFSIDPSVAEVSLGEVFDYLSSKSDREIVIAFDEFQQVAKYPETGTEALLRSYVQHMPQNVHFVFLGSQHHLLGEMFVSAKRPFYQSTTLFELPLIPEDVYCDFAERFFVQEGRSFSKDAFHVLYDRFDGVTWYMQVVLNEIWACADDFSAPQLIDEAVSGLVARRKLVFHDLLQSQSESARCLLKAIARERRVESPMAQGFIRKHALSALSTVSGAIDQLMSKELIYKGANGYIVYDYLLAEYLRNI